MTRRIAVCDDGTWRRCPCLNCGRDLSAVPTGQPCPACGPTCPQCGRCGTEFGHGTWEALAMTLAEPLRRALDRHLDDHGCGTGDARDPRYVGGFLHCPQAATLFDLLPDGDRILRA